LFVGGFDISVTEEQLVKFFNHYLQRKGGDSVKNFKMIYDKRTGISRCFGFVTILNSEQQVQTLLKNKYISCYGKQIEIKSVDADLASGGKKKTARREREPVSSRFRIPSRPSMFSIRDLDYERRRSNFLSYEEAKAYHRNLQRRRSGYVEGIYSAEMIESYRRRRSKHISKDLMRQMKEKMES
jgi:RNA recognition motif-containing protein